MALLYNTYACEPLASSRSPPVEIEVKEAFAKETYQEVGSSNREPGGDLFTGKSID